MLTAAVARYLADLAPAVYGTYGVAGSTIHVEDLPATPVDGIGIYFKTAPVDNAGDGYAREAFQIVVRRTNTTGRARSGYEVAKSVRDTLDGLRYVTLAEGTDDEVQLRWCLSDDSGPTNLGDDANGVPRWSLRFTTLAKHDTAHSIV
jgi:hypothetical protein